MGSSPPAPRYYEIEQALRERIARLSPGDSLPSDAMLCDEFGVSRMTARNAVQRLVQEGLVERARGHGTFVAPRTKPADARGSLELAVSLLYGLTDQQEASPDQLAEISGCPRADAAPLLRALERLELVERGSGVETYRLGLGLLRLGFAVVARFDERQAALPVMERLHQETEETVYLCIRRDSEAVCIERIDGRRVQSLALRLGGSLPLHLGAAPRALLAFEDRSFWDEYLARDRLETMTSRSPATADAVRSELERTLRAGYATSDGDVVAQFAAIGAPVFDHNGRIRASLALAGLRERILCKHENANALLLVEGAGQVSRALGYDDKSERTKKPSPRTSQDH